MADQRRVDVTLYLTMPQRFAAQQVRYIIETLRGRGDAHALHTTLAMLDEYATLLEEMERKADDRGTIGGRNYWPQGPRKGVCK